MADTGRAADAVLLDLDGTLVASADAIIACVCQAMLDLGHQLEPSPNLSWVVGPPLHDSLAHLLDRFGDDRVALAIERYRYHYEGGAMLDSPAFPGIETALRSLRRSGRRLFLATSKPLHAASRIVEALGFAALFSGMYGARPDDAGSEKAALIGDLVAREGLDPAAAVMVGDRRFDVAGAHANRMRAIGVLWGYGDRAELEVAGADALVGETAGLVSAIDAQLAAAAAAGG